MEENVQKLINLGLGAIAEAKEQFENAVSKINEEIILLENKGEADQSEQAVAARKFAAENTEKARILLGDADSFIQEVRARFTK